MSAYFSPQGPGPVQPGALHGSGRGHTYQHPLATAVVPSKRSVEDDDDIQFISEKPVKRQRTNGKQPEVPTSQQPVIPLATNAATAACNIVPNVPITTTPIPGGDPRDTERRLSTGMVGLPSDIQALELAYGLRGVSMPVLENFDFDQPSRKPRPSSPPELSPKQLPSTISPEMLDMQSGYPVPGTFGGLKPSNNSIPCQNSRHTAPCQVENQAMTTDLAKATPDNNQTPILIAPNISNSHSTPRSSDHGHRADSKSDPMPPPPPPPAQSHPEGVHGAPPNGSSPRTSPKPSENHHHHNTSTTSQKHPCQVCSRLRHQAQFPRAQGLPMVNTALPHHFMPQLHYHAPYGQHLHPQILAMPTGNTHQYGSNFAPVMVPVNGNPFMPLSSHQPPRPPPQQSAPQQQASAEKDKEAISERSRKTASPQISQVKNTTADTSATSSPIKPPASLIQPTYRKPSPNLIVDVAETCQEKFPFEEVAKRHNVPVEKVFDVFAAIIQVPLLRCPTDRRRAGKLATARIKEYNKAKKDIQDSRADNSETDGKAVAVDSTDVAQRLGRVEFPEGFKVGGKS